MISHKNSSRQIVTAVFRISSVEFLNVAVFQMQDLIETVVQ